MLICTQTLRFMTTGSGIAISCPLSGAMAGAFDEKTLVSKLSKLTKSKSSIESLSRWCISHRNKADVIVATWYKEVHSSETKRRIPLLHVANDILLRSKRGRDEFLDKFRKVLPAAASFIIENGDDYIKDEVRRLVGIWEDGKIFIRETMLDEETSTGRSKYSDLRSLKRKLMAAFDLVLKDRPTEEDGIRTCKSAIQNSIREMEKEADLACTIGRHSERESSSNELLEQERLLRRSVKKLKLVEANRIALVSKLREALREQEFELKNLQSEMEVGLSHAEKASWMQKTNAEVAADKLAASNNPQQILASVLSNFFLNDFKEANFKTPSSSESSVRPDSLSTQIYPSRSMLGPFPPLPPGPPPSLPPQPQLVPDVLNMMPISSSPAPPPMYPSRSMLMPFPPLPPGPPPTSMLSPLQRTQRQLPTYPQKIGFMQVLNLLALLCDVTSASASPSSPLTVGRFGLDSYKEGTILIHV